MKKVLSILLSLMLIFTMIPLNGVVALAEEKELVTVYVSGGTVAKRGSSSAADQLTAPVGTAVTVTADDIAGKEFSSWKTDSGDKITDKTFDLLLERNTGIYATYSNWKGDFGKWELCDSKANCSEYAVSYRMDASTGLKEFRVENTGGHYYDMDNKTIIKENTCTSYGLYSIKCQYCGEAIEEIIEPCHKMSPYTVYEEASGAKHGKMRSTCERCGYYEERDYISAIPLDTRNYNIKYDSDDYYDRYSYACRTEEHWKTDNEYMYKVHITKALQKPTTHIRWIIFILQTTAKTALYM